MSAAEDIRIELAHRDLLRPETEQDCPAELRLRCCYVSGHPTGHYDGRVEQWLGWSARCGVPHGPGHYCIRAKAHRGEHEDETGATWRRTAATKTGQSPGAAHGSQDQGT